MRVALIVVFVAISTGCASTGATPSPFPTATKPAAGRPSAAAVPAAPVASSELVGTALALRGTHYRNGGADLNGFDCSGFVQYVFAQHGLGLPRTVAEQYEAGRKINPRDLQPGDLVFFRTSGGDTSHVGIALGDDAFVHAPSSSGVVRVEMISAKYWASRFAGARRYQ
jgi:cell wall-associated NlpC family hydrolase